MIFNSKREGMKYVLDSYGEVSVVSEKIYSVVFINSKGESFLQLKREINGEDKWELIDERK